MKKHIFFLIANIIGGLTLTAQEGEVINHIFDGNQQAELKEFNEAEMAYRRALSKAPEKPEALYNLGNTHFEEQDFDEAKQRYFQTQKFTENKFSKQQAFHNLGNVFMKQKDYAKAVEAYKNALRNNPEDEETRYNYALAKELLKKEQDQQNQDQQNEDEQENKDQNQDQNKEGDKDKDSGQDNDEEQGDQGDKDEDKKEEGDQKKENQPQQGDQEKEQPAQPRKTELSPDQVKSLLEAMSNQEKKVQDKVNAEKVQGIPVRGQKDW